MEITKGEWKSSFYYPYTVYSTDGKRPPTTTPIAVMTSPDQVECEANSRLIAQAPRLCEALDTIIAHFLKLDKLYSKDLEMLNLGSEVLAKVER